VHKDEGTNFKVIFLDGGQETLDKLGSRLLSGLQDPSQEFHRDPLVFLELLGMAHNEILGCGGTSRGGRRYVASAMSSGRTASTPCAMKYGE